MENADKELFISHLRAFSALPNEVVEEYVSYWKPFSAPKKTILTAEGETERYMYFVLDGIQKSYYVIEGKVHVIAFTYFPSFSGVPDSFFTQTPSPLFLETISDSRFLRITHEDHQNMLAKHHSLETFFRKGTEMILIGVMKRHFELMAYDIEKRFTTFAQRSPHLINKIPQKDLASYLRIDATNFSKLMNSVQF